MIRLLLAAAIFLVLLSVVGQPADFLDLLGNAEAAEPGISDSLPSEEANEYDTILERLAAERGMSVDAWLEELDARIKEDERERLIVSAVLGVTALVVIVVLFMARRRIAARWRRGSKDFRVWVFASFSWAVGAVLFVWLVEPYGSNIDDDDISHLFSVMIVPPLFFGAFWFMYKRFVK